MTMWPDTTAAAGRTTGPPTREYRATTTFVVAAIFLTVAVLLFGRYMDRFASTSAIYVGLLGIVINVIAAWGLAAGRGWARYAMTPLLWIYVGAGILVFVVALSRNSFNIPIGGIVAAWALYAKPSEALGPVPAQSVEGTLLILGAIVAAVIQFF